MALLECSHISYTRDDKAIIEDLDLGVESGDFISIVGPSGSGKSTLLKLCCDLISPTKGDILFHNQSVDTYIPTDLRKKISYCLQTPYLFGDKVIENIEFPFAIRNEAHDQQRVEDLFSAFQMTTDFLQKDVKNLSGGEKQRIALIRSLLFQPEILLLDEVTSALDVANTQIVEDVIVKLNNAGTTLLWITHNPEQSRRYANKLLTIDSGKVKSLEVIR
ncbi:ATP-binding cassette domain-containing protein [Sporolactobacillus kofuensis]|uniref:ATP-binding cassette domain-containing protein n=1 Tax=Sporolactobacillus kofuensis TaxID=269672 RepID=A0ABW1WFK0_9BACL|nr:ATP-binding cassette domain-containing protein [Sporolactobacillus kofuensis]